MHLPTIFRRGVPALAVTGLLGVVALPPLGEDPRPSGAEATSPAVEEVVETGPPAPAEARAATAGAASDAAEASTSAAAEGSGRASATRPALEVHRGEATYYHDALHGRATASGIPYDRDAMVAAHRSLPFGTLLRVTNTGNGRQVLVRVVDRGPFAPGHDAPAILDVSRRAARELGFIRQGRVLIQAEVLEWGEG